MLDNCDRLKALPETIGYMVGLRKLHLSGCKAVVYIPSSLSSLSNLQELSLSAKGLSSLPNCLESLVGMRHFELFDISACTKIDFVYSFKYLQELYLSKVEKPSESITELMELKKLFLSLSAEVRQLPDYIVQLSRLRELYLHDCAGLEALPNCINKLTNMRILDMTNCSKLTELPDGIGQMTQLQKLRLKGCRALKCLPESISDLSEQCRATLSTALRINSVREGKLGNSTL
jgi:Leucine-rich repeat (LRR) protein